MTEIPVLYIYIYIYPFLWF